MRSYFLNGVDSRDAAERALDVALPGQRDPWLLVDETGDPVAYFGVHDEDPDRSWQEPHEQYEPGPMVQADLSGRHFGHDRVVPILLDLRARVGGVLRGDYGEVVLPLGELLEGLDRFPTTGQILAAEPWTAQTRATVVGPLDDPSIEGAGRLSRFLRVGEAQGLRDNLAASGESHGTVVFRRLCQAAGNQRTR